MIVMHEHRSVFVSVPKCGTKTLYEYLPAVLGGIRIQSAGFHGVRIPSRLSDYRVLTCVRNPYERAVSLWWSTCRRGGDRYGFRARVTSRGGDPASFEDFMWMLIEDAPCVAWLGPPMSEHLRGVPVGVVLRLESLAADLAAAFPEQKNWPGLPVNNATRLDRPSAAEYLAGNFTSRQLVEQWARNDFERFGYERSCLVDGG